MEFGICRTIYHKEKGFLRVGLSEQEEQDLMQSLRDMHVRLLRECVADAMSVIGKTAPSNLVRIACALFERRAPATYTIYQESLAKKIHALKNGGENHD